MKKLLIFFCISSCIFSNSQNFFNKIKHPLSDNDFEYVFKKYKRDLSATDSEFSTSFLRSEYVANTKKHESASIFIKKAAHEYDEIQEASQDKIKTISLNELFINAFAHSVETLETYQALAEFQDKPIDSSQYNLFASPSSYLALTSFVQQPQIKVIQKATRARWIRFLLVRLSKK